jgi:DNA-binding NarL/FixJ family response regulator
VSGGKRIPSLCCQSPPKKASVTKTEGPIHLVIAGNRGLFWETMKIVLDGEPDMCVRAFSHEGRSAFELSEELKPDVLVLDGNLPNGDSLEMNTHHVTIAHTLMISPQTVRTHLQNVLGRLRGHSRREVIEFVRRNEPLPEPLGVMS